MSWWKLVMQILSAIALLLIVLSLTVVLVKLAYIPVPPGTAPATSASEAEDAQEAPKKVWSGNYREPRPGFKPGLE